MLCAIISTEQKTATCLVGYTYIGAVKTFWNVSDTEHKQKFGYFKKLIADLVGYTYIRVNRMKSKKPSGYPVEYLENWIRLTKFEIKTL